MLILKKPYQLSAAMITN